MAQRLFSDTSCEDSREPNQTLDEDPPNKGELNPPVGVVGGAIYGLLASALYTAANIALRESVGVDALLVSAVKSVPIVVLLGPVIGWMSWRGKTIITSTEMIPRFVLSSLTAQFVGNVAFQLALGIVGLASSVTITLGAMIIGGAIFGRLFLKEPISFRVALSMITLIAAVVVLNLSFGETPEETQNSGDFPLWVGGLFAVASGLAYSMFGAVTRQALINGLTPQATMFISGLMGLLTLWLATFCWIDLSEIAAINATQWWIMLAAGMFNFLAFITLTCSLKALPVIAVNLLNATQVAMAAAAGVFFFSEQITQPLIWGIALTFAGLAILATKRKQDS